MNKFTEGAEAETAAAASHYAGLLIDGALHSGAVTSHYGPMSPNVPVATFTSGSEDHINSAVSSARVAARSWGALSVQDRAAGLQCLADLVQQQRSVLAAAVVAEMGKPIRDAEAEIDRAVAIVRWVAGAALQAEGDVLPSVADGRLLYTLREPLGVVGVVTPWNFPVALPLWKIAPALARGNTVVWKPSETAPLTPAIMTQQFLKSGFPAGVINVVPSSSRETGRNLVEHAEVDAVSFTGSRATGQNVRLAAARRGAKLQAELGGKNAAVLCADANLDISAEMVARGAMLLAGQRCTATSRVIVDRRIADRFIAMLIHRIAALHVGDPTDRQTDIGPVASAQQFAKISGYLEDLRVEGTEVLLGGQPADVGHELFIPPTVYLDPSGRSKLWSEEVFGPVIGITICDGLDDGIEKADATRYGLSASIFTESLSAAMRFARRVRTGVVHINGETAGTEPHAPYGGLKDSGSHAPEQGMAGLNFFADTKTVYLDQT